MKNINLAVAIGLIVLTTNSAFALNPLLNSIEATKLSDEEVGFLFDKIETFDVIVAITVTPETNGETICIQSKLGSVVKFRRTIKWQGESEVGVRKLVKATVSSATECSRSGT